MEQVLREYTGADLAYYNRGGVRDAIRPGPVTVRTLWNIEPFGNSVVTLKVTGAQVRSILATNGDDAGIELEDSRTYLFATNNFVGAHVRRTLGASVNLQDSGVLVRDILIEAIKTGGLPGQ
jgi:2',3'-cyclic-nucleotide 2'-phosphodiesterase (5'-nucleotidase family)